MSSATESTIQRRRILIQGIVQGVGFRPFVYGQAQRLGLTGFVLNNSQGVTIEVEGPYEALDGFQQTLREKAPPLARIDSVAIELIPACHAESFVITHSQSGAERLALISPDSATCDDCLRELFDPADRRYRYPFINCTNCGPRFTIVQDVPYDRDKTTMRVFPMCPSCQAEYDDPGNRRFHAQPNACPVCGPQVRLLEMQPERFLCHPERSEGSQALAHDSPATQILRCAQDDMGELTDLEGEKSLSASSGLAPDYSDQMHTSSPGENEPISNAAQRLASGAILAIKGLGGYHLACDALNLEAVRQLRQRKHREAKPFALMVRDLETARRLCRTSDAEAALLQSQRRPIVLLEQLPDCPVAPDIAPGCNTLGIMLPYTPLHHLLLRAFTQTIEPGQPAALVMTSGNVSDEPIAYKDDDAQKRLADIAGGMLAHNRDIHMRCDDSVTRIVAGGEQFLRRSRGYAPEPLSLAFEMPEPLLACGGHLKNTFCLGKGKLAFLSHHIGDLENLETLTSFREGIAHFQRLFDIFPRAVVYDLHPEYLATKYALELPLERKIGVQHHHAHIASVLAEHELRGPVIGIAADGTGYGTDGAIWGCEALIADLGGFERLAHLAYAPLPGGEQAVRQPWRVAAAYLRQAYGEAFLELDIPFTRRLNRTTWRALSQMIEKGINSPPTSSLGRLFDAVAALLEVRGEVVYEGQAAIELEMLAQSAAPRRGDKARLYPFALKDQAPIQLDVSPMIRAIVADVQRGVAVREIARRFHLTIAELLAVTCDEARRRTGLVQVALSGGVFQNRILLELLMERLEAMAFRVYINRRVPPNDGGLSFGQLAVAAARLQQL